VGVGRGASVAIVLILTGAALLVLRSARSLPGRDRATAAARRSPEPARGAAAFRTGSESPRRSTATRRRSSARRGCKFAELRQEEVFERRDAAAVLWGALALPDVVVEARTAGRLHVLPRPRQGVALPLERGSST
jgi:hypothetical protein